LENLQDFSGMLGVGVGVTTLGVTGLYVALGGCPEVLGTTFFGFFFSLPRASRFPIK
jgi:hypothetical protein